MRTHRPLHSRRRTLLHPVVRGHLPSPLANRSELHGGQMRQGREQLAGFIASFDTPMAPLIRTASMRLHG